mmetsp:Transcript_23507/g.70369  ORF Transcript_23507/g.70369 Transcript_23507/m.70369 type:complete len:82 (-) Transcript_23507:984-1229(-)
MACKRHRLSHPKRRSRLWCESRVRSATSLAASPTVAPPMTVPHARRRFRKVAETALVDDVTHFTIVTQGSHKIARVVAGQS